jgi:hypothetical protein
VKIKVPTSIILKVGKLVSDVWGCKRIWMKIGQALFLNNGLLFHEY